MKVNFLRYNQIMKILLLEDDSVLSEIIEEFLRENGYDVSPFFDGKEALTAIYAEHFDLFLLDINVPYINGFELLTILKEANIQTPAIYITSLDQISDVKKGFALGAEDYLKKPFDLEELLVRIERTKKLHNIDTQTQLSLGENIFFEPHSLELKTPLKTYKLRKKEAQLLEFFLKHPNRIVSYDEIIDDVWRFDEVPTHSTLRSYIKTLRSYGLERQIDNTKGVGYVFKPL